MSRSHCQQHEKSHSGSTIQFSYSARTTPTREFRRGPFGVPIQTFQEDASSDGSQDETSPVFPRRPVSLRHVRLAGCREMCTDRVPKGKASLLVFILVMIEHYAFIGAVDNILHFIPELKFADSDDINKTGLGYFINTLLNYCIGRLFYPIGGYLADVFLGRYRVIHISLLLYWIAFGLMTLITSLEIYDLKPLSYYIIPILLYVCIILASGGFQSTVIPFGADQLEAASSSELSSYIYWYYFALQVGAISNITVDATISYHFPESEHKNRIIQSMIVVSLISLALVLHTYFKHWYFINPVRENCIRLVRKVVCYVAKVKRRIPQYRRAFRYGEGKISRIELAKQKYDGIYTGDQVEDVKTFCRICLVLFSLTGVFFTSTAVDAMLSYRLNGTLSVGIANPGAAKAFLPNSFAFINTFSLILAIPLVNHILIPCVSSMTIKQKLGIGMAINVVAIITGAYLEWATFDVRPLYKGLLLIIPSIIVSIQEAFCFASILEFIYAQSPESMKGMLTGICFFILGIVSGGASAVFYIFVQPSSSLIIHPNVYYYLILLVFSMVGFITYVIVACLYTNHQRPLNEDDEAQVRLLYNTFLPT